MTTELTDEVLARLESHAHDCTGTDTYCHNVCDVTPDELLALIAAARHYATLRQLAEAVVEVRRRTPGPCDPKVTISDILRAIDALEKYLK